MEKLKEISQAFIKELLTGISSCMRITGHMHKQHYREIRERQIQR